MNKKTKKEKNIEYHKRRTRDMVLYVRERIGLERLRRECDSVAHNIEYLQMHLCEDDLIIADAIVKSGVGVDEFLDKFDELEKRDYVCPFGGIE